MLRSVVEILRNERIDRGFSADIRITLKNALLESFCIHLRNLLYFFYERKQKDDVKAADFMPAGIRWCPGKLPNRAKLKDRLDKEIAHLTWKRISDPKEKEWKWTELYEEFYVVITSFKQKADRSSLDCIWDDEAIESLSPSSASTATSQLDKLGLGGSHSGATESHPQFQQP